MSTRTLDASTILAGFKWSSTEMGQAVEHAVENVCDERDALYDRIDRLEETVSLLSTKIHTDHEVDVQQLGMQAANKVLNLIEDAGRITSDAVKDVFISLMKDMTERAVGFKALCNAYELCIEQMHNGYVNPEVFGRPASHLLALGEFLDEANSLESIEVQLLGESVDESEKKIEQMTKDLEMARGTPGRLWTLISNILQPIKECFYDRKMPYATFERLAKEWVDSITGNGHPDIMMQSLTTAREHVKTLRGAVEMVLDASEDGGDMNDISWNMLREALELTKANQAHAQA